MYSTPSPPLFSRPPFPCRTSVTRYRFPRPSFFLARGHPMDRVRQDVGRFLTGPREWSLARNKEPHCRAARRDVGSYVTSCFRDFSLAQFRGSTSNPRGGSIWLTLWWSRRALSTVPSFPSNVLFHVAFLLFTGGLFFFARFPAHWIGYTVARETDWRVLIV